MSLTQYEISVDIDKQPYNYGGTTTYTVGVFSDGIPASDSITEQIGRQIATSHPAIKTFTPDKDDPNRDGLGSYVESCTILQPGYVEIVIKRPNID